MPSSGSGSVIPIPYVSSPSTGHIYPPILPDGFTPGITLDRYQELMRLPIAAFNGLNKPDEEPVYECSTIWKQSERNALMIALAQAEEMRERELSYHISPKYKMFELPYANPIVLDRKYLIKLGKQTTADIALSTVLNLGTEPAVNDPVIITFSTTLTDAAEIKVYYPGEDYNISPSHISISGGIATIKIPRSRLVKPELLDDRDDHLYYADNDNFLDNVDIKRVYYDTTNRGEFVWILSCDVTTLEEQTQSLYTHILNNRLSAVQIYPATYASGSWTKNAFTQCIDPDFVRLYALTGREQSIYTDMLTIRLAHTLMPNSPCSCPTVHQYWEDDITQTEIYTPYGNSRGAVNAWSMDARAKVGQGGKFPRM